MSVVAASNIGIILKIRKPDFPEPFLLLGLKTKGLEAKQESEPMTITISPDLLDTAGLSEAEFLREIAVLLCRQRRLTTAQGAELAQMNRFDFQKLLAEREVPAYTREAFEHDLKVTGYADDK